jgi:hypothetical protein
MPAQFIDTNGISFNGDRASRVIDIPTEAALMVFDDYAVRRPVLAENLVGLYSFVRPRPGDPHRVRFGRLTTPRHLLQKANGCGWNPKGRVTMGTEVHQLGSVDYDGEQCPDEFAECLEGIFGQGNDAKDMLGTPAGRALFEQLLSRVYTGLGNSMWDLLHFANHPVIDLADAGGWSPVTAAEWADYIGQQTHEQVGGLITILDQLKDVTGLEQLQATIQSSDVSADGRDYTGDVIDLFNSLVATALPDFQIMVDEVRGQGAPIIVCSRSIFQAYKNYLTATYNAIPEGFQLFYRGEDGTSYPVRNVLQWDGIWVVQASAWNTFDRINGVTTHRAVLTAPGNFGVGYDVQDVLTGQYGGIGLMVKQWLEPPYKGKVYMSTRFGLTGAIVNPDFLSMAAYIHQPA